MVNGFGLEAKEIIIIWTQNGKRFVPWKFLYFASWRAILSFDALTHNKNKLCYIISFKAPRYVLWSRWRLQQFRIQWQYLIKFYAFSDPWCNANKWPQDASLSLCPRDKWNSPTDFCFLLWGIPGEALCRAPVPLHCPPGMVLSYLCSSVSYCPGLGHDLSPWAAVGPGPLLRAQLPPWKWCRVRGRMAASWRIELTQQAEESISPNKHRLQ